MQDDRIMTGDCCGFCGKDLKDHTPRFYGHYLCKCGDAQKARKLLKQIEKLKDQIPEKKYEFRQRLEKVRE